MTKEREEYRGRDIVVRTTDDEAEAKGSEAVEIDGERIEAKRAVSGRYYLPNYAYDRSRSLMKVAERYVDDRKARNEE